MDSLHDPSWWTQAHHEQFTAQALARLPEMQKSKFGQPDVALAVGPLTEAAHSRMVRAARAKLATGFRFMAGE